VKNVPSIGRIVHFVQNGVHYAALIVKVWSETCVNLQVFPNGSDHIVSGALDSTGRAHSVSYSEPTSCCGHVKDWSWHWPETV
jgi:hypothetical protein